MGNEFVPALTGMEPQPNGTVKATYADGSWTLLPGNDRNVQEKLRQIAEIQRNPNPSSGVGGSGGAPQAPAPVDMGGSSGPTREPAQSTVPQAPPTTQAPAPTGDAMWKPQQQAPDIGPPPAVRAAPAYVVKGGRVTQGWNTTTEEGFKLPPELQEQQNRADEADRDAAYFKGEAAKLRDRNYNDWLAGESAAAQERRAEAEARQARKEAMLADIQARVDKYKEIDPNRLWNNTSGFGKALATIASFLPGTGSKVNGIDKAIKEDVDIQLKNLESARQEVKDFYSQWDSEDSRRAAGELTRLQDTKRELEMWHAGARSLETKASIQNEIARVDREIANRKAHIAEKEAGKTVVQRHDVNVPDRVVGGGVDSTGSLTWLLQKGFTPEDIQKKAAAIEAATGRKGLGVVLLARSAGMNAVGARPESETAGVEMPKASTYVPAAGGFARNEKEAEKLADLASDRDQVIANLRRIKELRQQSMLNRVPGSKALEEANGLIAKNAGIIKGPKFQNSGAALTPQEKTDLLDPLTGFGSLDLMSRDATVDARIDAAIRIMDNAFSSTVRNSGIVPGKVETSGRGIRPVVTGAPSYTQQGSTPFKPAGAE